MLALIGFALFHLLRFDFKRRILRISIKNSPHLAAVVSFVGSEMHLVRERHFNALHLVLKLLEMANLLHECFVMQSFVNEPHEDVNAFFFGV